MFFRKRRECGWVCGSRERSHTATVHTHVHDCGSATVGHTQPQSATLAVASTPIAAAPDALSRVDRSDHAVMSHPATPRNRSEMTNRTKWIYKARYRRASWSPGTAWRVRHFERR